MMIAMTKQYFTFGLHAVEALLTKNSARIILISVQRERQDKKIAGLMRLAAEAGITVDMVSKQELDRLVDANHQGIVAITQKAAMLTEEDIPGLLENLSAPAFILLLDGVQDPHNLGAIFRSADAAGVNLIIAPKDKAVGITPAVSKVACGATESVPFVQVTNLVRTMEKLKEMGIWLYGAAGEASASVYQIDFTGSVALVLGAEGEGLRRLTREHCDGLINIPMNGFVSSLNVSVATGIILFEVVRQRLHKKMEC